VESQAGVEPTATVPGGSQVSPGPTIPLPQKSFCHLSGALLGNSGTLPEIQTSSGPVPEMDPLAVFELTRDQVVPSKCRMPLDDVAHTFVAQEPHTFKVSPS
jgi:hypothetical protein